LKESAQARGSDRRKSPPREGPALLQGLVICGVCGSRMRVRYHVGKEGVYPEYICQSICPKISWSIQIGSNGIVPFRE